MVITKNCVPRPRVHCAYFSPEYNLTSSTAYRVLFSPPDSLCLAGCPGYTPAAFEQVAPPTKSSFSIKELIGDGILWAVPHHRRSIERRLKRKFAPNFPSIVHRNNRLTICSHCGNHKEIGLLCRNNTTPSIVALLCIILLMHLYTP